MGNNAIDPPASLGKITRISTVFVVLDASTGHVHEAATRFEPTRPSSPARLTYRVASDSLDLYKKAVNLSVGKPTVKKVNRNVNFG